MGVLKRFFICNTDNCKYEWSSIAYQMEEQQCPKCTRIAQYYKTKQKMKNGSLVGTYECAGRKGKTCGRTWKSAVAFKGSWQMCTRCQTKCFPVHVIEHDYEDVTTVVSSMAPSISSEMASINLDDNNNQGGEATLRDGQEASRSDENQTNLSEETENKEEDDESHLPKRQVQNQNNAHIMANCGMCIKLGKNCVKHFEFIRNPEKEKAAKRKADKLRPMLKMKMYEEQKLHLNYVTNMMGTEEQKAKLQKIEKMEPPSSGSDDEHPPPPPPAHKRRYRKRKSKKPIKKSED